MEDGSNDNSAEVCRRIASETEFVKFYQHPDQKNHGAGPTRNYAIELANYPYIAFLDADDFYLNNRFKKTKDVFKNHLDADGVYECLGVHFENEQVKKSWIDQKKKLITTVNEKINPSNLFYELLKGGKGYFHLNTLTLRSTSIDIKFSDLKLSQDVLFTWMLAASKNLYPGEIKHPVAIRRVHDENRHTKSLKSLISYQLNAHETLVQWLEERSFDAEKTNLARRVAYSRKIDIISFDPFFLRVTKLFQLLIKSIPNRQLIFSKYSIKLVLSLLGVFKILKLFYKDYICLLSKKSNFT